MNWKHLAKNYFLVHNNSNNFLIRTLPFSIYKLDKKIDENDLLNNIKKKRIPLKTFTNSFSLDLIIATSCNFRCKYCYALSEGTNGFYGLPEQFMSEKNAKKSIDISINKLINIISKSKKKDGMFDLFITGGEPLLNYEVVVSSILYLDKKIELLKKKGINITRSIEIATNGSLMTPEIMNFLKKTNVQIAITLDGIMHDSRRPMKNGKPTSKIIINNIDKLIKNDNIIKLQSIIPLGNKEYLNALFLYYKKLGYLEKIKRIHVIPESRPIHKTYISDEIYFPNEKDLTNYSNELMRLSKKYNLDIKNYHGRLIRSINIGGFAHRCPIALFKYAIAPNGNVYPCNQLMNIEKYKMGNISDGIMDINIINVFKKRVVFKVEPCSKCLFQTICIPFVDCPARCIIENKNLYKVPLHYCKVHLPYMENVFSYFLENIVNKNN
jgi:uncharacterized protein